jgi:hypothetical protein
MSLYCFARRPITLILQVHLLISAFECLAWRSSSLPICRRAATSSLFGNTTATMIGAVISSFTHTGVANSVDVKQESTSERSFISAAYGREEYTNAIVASRDTNISPAEAYDVIRQRIPSAHNNVNGRRIRAADIGAGAGLSTTILYTEKGYHDIAAVDWSRTAWDASVVQQDPVLSKEVQFYEMDDDTFFTSIPTKNNVEDRYFDIIVYNFAINKDKAIRTAQDFLTTEGLLLAPCNDRNNYWYKQSYILFDQTGTAIWTSDAYIDAWLIQFQPDVTSKDCTGIWCGNFNGFFDKQKQSM